MDCAVAMVDMIQCMTGKTLAASVTRRKILLTGQNILGQSLMIIQVGCHDDF